MTATIILAVAIPGVLTVAALTARRARLALPQRDARGIALQTVIIMVVLLAIAGSVAAVLLTRGGDAVDDLDRSAIGPAADEYTNERLCLRAGYEWSTVANTCWTNT